MPPETKEKSGKKGKGCLIVLVIFLVIVIVVNVIFWADIFNFRSNIVAPYLRNAPLIGSFFDRSAEEDDDPLFEMSEEELRTAIIVYRNQVAALEAERAERDAQIANANTRIAHLSRFELRWQEYRAAAALFTQMLAHNEPFEFVEFFENIVDHDLVPQDILAMAFAEAQAINIYDAELQVLVSTYNNMEAGGAAEALERLLMANTTLAVRLVRAMSNSRRGEIFDEMEYTTVATFTMLLATEPPTFTPLVPPPYLPEIFAPVTPPAIVPVEELDEEEEEEEEDEEIEEEPDDEEEEI